MRTSAIAAVLWLPRVPATATAADPAAESRAAWERVGSATFTLDQDALADVLEDAPVEGRRSVRTLTISVPAPDGGFERFAVVESPVMEPGLAAAHPEIKTYTARGLDDPSATARLDLTPLGFHASVRSASGAWYVDPRDGEHVAYRRGAVAAQPFPERAARRLRARRRAARGRGRRRARSRCACTGWRCSRTRRTRATTPGTTTAAKVVLVNRLNQIYEQDLAIRLLLVAGNDQLNLDTAAVATGTNGPCGAAACYTTRSCRPATARRSSAPTPSPAGSWAPGATTSPTWSWHADGGGLAGLGVVGTPFKGGACTARPNPVGDAFSVDYVAHEVGHQFGAEHTFNSRECASNLAATQAVRVEPGSGTSIMAYAGTCGADDLQDHSDPYFSQASVAQIAAHGAERRGAPAAGPAGRAQRLRRRRRLRAQLQRRHVGAGSPTGGNYTAAGIEAAIEGIAGWPAGASGRRQPRCRGAASPSTSSAWRRPRRSRSSTRPASPAGSRA